MKVCQLSRKESPKQGAFPTPHLKSHPQYFCLCKLKGDIPSLCRKRRQKLDKLSMHFQWGHSREHGKARGKEMLAHR